MYHLNARCDHGEGRGGGVYGVTELSAQFFCGPKTALKNRLFLFLKRSGWEEDRSQLKLGNQNSIQIRKTKTLQIAVWGELSVKARHKD